MAELREELQTKTKEIEDLKEEKTRVQEENKVTVLENFLHILLQHILWTCVSKYLVPFWYVDPVLAQDYTAGLMWLDNQTHRFIVVHVAGLTH